MSSHPGYELGADPDVELSFKRSVLVKRNACRLSITVMLNPQDLA